ncbi:MAG: hypothetical protein ACRD8O_10695 [Bryobacteraceae bacterium]
MILGRLRAARVNAPVPQAIQVYAILTVVIGLAALAAWQISGNIQWITSFFKYPGNAFSLACGLAEIWLSWHVWRQFSRDEPLHQAWCFIFFAALCRLTGVLITKVLPLGDQDVLLNRAGLALGGPLYLFLLAAGLWCVLDAYRKLDPLPRLTPVDAAAILIVAGYTVLHFLQVGSWISAGKPIDSIRIISWSADPLLCPLVGIAVYLRRYAHGMGGGLIGFCWQAYALGVFATSLGDMGIAAEAYGWIAWPWNSLIWFIWFFADAAFALAPAYQFTALQRVWQRSPSTSLEPGRS